MATPIQIERFRKETDPGRALTMLNELWHGSTPSSPAVTPQSRHDGAYRVFEISGPQHPRNGQVLKIIRDNCLKDFIEQEHVGYLRIAYRIKKY